MTKYSFEKVLEDQALTKAQPLLTNQFLYYLKIDPESSVLTGEIGSTWVYNLSSCLELTSREITAIALSGRKIIIVIRMRKKRLSTIL